MRIRHYGILANGRRKEKLARCRELLAASEVEPSSAIGQAVLDEQEWAEAERCARCGVGRMQRREELSPDGELPPSSVERIVSITHSGRASPAV